MRYLKFGIFIFYLIFYCTEVISAVLSDNKLEFSGLVGPTWPHVGTGHINVSQYERDTLITQHVGSAAVFRLGVGYHALASVFENRDVFNDFLIELNWYVTTRAIVEGKVWQSGEAIFTNYAFKSQLSSNRLMIDTRPTFVNVRKIAIYPIVGVGAAWVRMTYNESILNSSVSSQSYISLNPNTTTQVAYDLGVGLRYPVFKNCKILVEYLYTNLHHAKASTQSNSTLSNATFISPPQFSFSNQSLMFGASWTV